MAADGNPAVQMVLPMAEMLGWLRKGVGELIRQAGLQLMDLMMQEEVRELVGERSERQAERTANRWAASAAYCVVDGAEGTDAAARECERLTTRKCGWAATNIPPRRTADRNGVGEIDARLSTRKYGQAVRQFIEAYGLEKSAVSEHFIEASRAKLKD